MLLCMSFSYHGFPETFPGAPSRTIHLKFDFKVRNASENEAMLLHLKHLQNLVMVHFKCHSYKELKVAACLEPDSKYISWNSEGSRLLTWWTCLFRLEPSNSPNRRQQPKRLFEFDRCFKNATHKHFSLLQPQMHFLSQKRETASLPSRVRYVFIDLFTEEHCYDHERILQMKSSQLHACC